MGRLARSARHKRASEAAGAYAENPLPNVISLSDYQGIVPLREMIYYIIGAAGAAWLTRVTQTGSFACEVGYCRFNARQCLIQIPIKPVGKSRVLWADGCNEFSNQNRQCPGAHALYRRAVWAMTF